MTQTNRFPKIDCPDCQQIRDGQQLFLILERLADREAIDPARMARAILQCAALWNVCSVALEAQDSTERMIDPDILETVDRFALALREAACKGSPDVRVSAAFAAETRELLDAADRRHHAH